MGSRFVSEFGMAAYPHLSTTTAAISDPKQQYPGSMFIDYHIRAGDHEQRMLTYVGENFRIKHDLAGFTHLTQMVQANAMDVAYSSWRRDWGNPGARKSGGLLVWQLNDCWPTMSWAIVDCNLVKKPAFYAIKRALKPVAVGVSRVFHPWTGGHSDPRIAIRDTSYDVWVASSRTENIQGEVTIRFVSIETGDDVAPRVKRSITVQQNATTEVIQKGAVDVKVDSNDATPFDHRNYDPYVICASLSVDGEIVSTHTAWPDPIKYLDFSDRGVEVEVADTNDSITVRAKKPVHGWVFQERKDWVKFSDNGFDIIPGEEKTIHVGGFGLDRSDLKWTYVGADS